jgi:hypothetical protein
MGGSTQEEQDNENNKTLKKQMARLKEILTPSLKEVAAETDLRVEQFEGRLLVCSPMWRKALSVESEKTAIIMSERYPDYLWLATGGLGQVQPEKFRPLRGHRLVLFPDTDPDGEAFKRWYDAARLVMVQPFWEDSPPIRVSSLLEQLATPEQKAAKIDIADFIMHNT